LDVHLFSPRVVRIHVVQLDRYQTHFKMINWM